MSYKVTITNNETGEVAHEYDDVVCIIGAYGSDDGVCETSMIKTNAVVAAATLKKAKAAVENTLKKFPHLSLAMALVDALGDSFMKARESENEDENTES